MKGKVFLLAALMAAICASTALSADCGSAVVTTQKKAATKRASNTQNIKGTYQTYEKTVKKTVPNPNFDSSEEASYYNAKEMDTEVRVKVSWPTAIPGATNLDPIYFYILGYVLEQQDIDIDIDDAVSNWVDNYVFDDFPGIEGPTLFRTFDHVVETPRFVTFEFSDIYYNGSGTAAGILHTEEFVVFDKKNSQWFTGEIFKDIKSPALLELVNTYVRKGDYGFGDAQRVPESIMPEGTKLTIIYPKYEIACGAEGNVSISIPYSKLLPYLTPEFRKLIGK